METLKKTLALMLLVTVISLGAAGCKKESDHPAADHPAGDHPSKEEVKEAVKDAADKLPAAEHPTEHPK